MTGHIVKYFGSMVFAARPKLQEITLNRETEQSDWKALIFTRSDTETKTIKPKDVARLFQS